MKVLFLDIDGVVNCATTSQRFDHTIGIDPFMALLVWRIVENTDAKIVLSSSWRYYPDSMKEVEKRVMPFIDTTPRSQGLTSRGHEIRQWLQAHPEVEKYAILDDNSDMLEEQMPNFFKTTWDTGLTEEIAEKVVEHLGVKPSVCCQAEMYLNGACSACGADGRKFSTKEA